jgi:hypothetical protein
MGVERRAAPAGPGALGALDLAHAGPDRGRNIRLRPTSPRAARGKAGLAFFIGRPWHLGTGGRRAPAQ